MKLTIEEIPDPRNHPGPWVECGNRPRYLAVLPVDSTGETRGAFTLCNDCGKDAALLDRLAAMAESF
jgi:hypothetical protein